MPFPDVKRYFKVPFNVASVGRCACVCVGRFVFFVAFLCLTFSDVTHLGAGKVRLKIHKNRLSDCSAEGCCSSPLAPRQQSDGLIS